jgi:hypothetical protein
MNGAPTINHVYAAVSEKWVASPLVKRPSANCLPEREVVEVLTESAATIVDIHVQPLAGLPDADRVYWVTQGIEQP